MFELRPNIVRNQNFKANPKPLSNAPNAITGDAEPDAAPLTPTNPPPVIVKARPSHPDHFICGTRQNGHGRRGPGGLRQS